MLKNDKAKIRSLDDLYKLAEDTLSSRGNIFTTSTFGGSMQPAILSGDEIVIDSSFKDNLSVGDIIAFAQGSLLVCHRIKELKTKESGERCFITQGDAHGEPDNTEVKLKFVAGKVIYLLRDKRKINPYQQVVMPSVPFAAKVKEKLKLVYSVFFRILRRGVGKILDYLGIKPNFKELIFKLTSFWIDYYFKLPRKRDSFPAVRFIPVMLKEVMQAHEGFFSPLRDIGFFRIAAQVKSRKIAEIEVSKLNESNQWAVTFFMFKSVFSGTQLEKSIFDYCRKILFNLNVEELYFLEYKENKSVQVFLKRWQAKWIKREEDRTLYLLSGEMANPCLIKNPVDFLKRLFKRILASLENLLQKINLYRNFKKIIYHPYISYTFEEAKPLVSYRFLAKRKDRIIGSVYLSLREESGKKEWWVYSLGVPLKFRGLGIARELMLELINFAKKKEINKLLLTVFPDKNPAIKLYEELGFVHKGIDNSGKLLKMERQCP